MNTLSKHSLRATILQKRHQLSQEQQIQAAKKLADLVIQLNVFHHCQHLGCYYAHKGEINPESIIAIAKQQGKNYYLPVLKTSQSRQLCFIQYQSGDPLIINRYGISEPAYNVSKEIKPEHLDLVFMPLVAFDEDGHRLGMGGGYYDNTFAFMKNQQTTSDKPYLIGLAYEWQKIAKLPREHHDVQLQAVITDSKIYSFTRAC